MFIHTHPYPPFIPDNATKLIVGTLPPPRFTTGDLKPDDVNFCYGSRDGMLWRILDRIFELNLVFDNTDFPIKQRKDFLVKQRIGICDIVDSAEREKIDASDLGMRNIKLRDLVGYLKKYPKVDTLLFTGGNSKNGPEYFFRRHLREYKLSLKLVEKSTPKIHQVEIDGRTVKTVSLTAPTGTANIAVGSNPLYKQLKVKNPEFNTFDFRVMQYREFFER
ncbi:uracil-DNA glycosylase family protein [Spongiivirga sp. MCCC 1A20706]|uniref:uracil-DNA glycosylase family protein n=1 Tax=Spongiivirga sp. MCCC 1A20706 TaxID=3160963 RepID=UPI0039773655